jgi:(1->4)-alpha-D-glucan 1-alpha-D-glucosylmutase
MLNSLTQTILKLTAPGVPDIYQGNELWDFTLVDPDNRQPVDYDSRTKILSEIQKETGESLFASWEDGRIKMFVISRLLHLRRTAPWLFQKGTYASFYGEGEFADSCVAFSREFDFQKILVIAPRFTTRLSTEDHHFDWKKTEVLLDSSVEAMKDLFTERVVPKGSDSIPLKNLDAFPFAVFHNLRGL